MSLKITDLPQIDTGTVTDHISIPVSKTESDPKTYKMPLSQVATYLQSKGFGGGGGAQGAQGFSGFSGAAGSNGTNGTSIQKGITLGLSPSKVFLFTNAGAPKGGTQISTITAFLQNLTPSSGNPVRFSFQLYNAAGTALGSAVVKTNTSTSPYNSVTYSTSDFVAQDGLSAGPAAYVLVTATFNDGTNTYTVIDQITKLTDGSGALVAVLTSPAIVVPTAADGSSPDLTNATGAMQVYYGSTLLSYGSGITGFSLISNTPVYNSGTNTGMTTTIDSGTGNYAVTVLGANSNTAQAVFQASTTYGAVQATLYVSKAKGGAAGSAKSLVCTASTNVIKQTGSNLSQSSIVFNVTNNNISTHHDVGVTAVLLNSTGGTVATLTTSSGITITSPNSVYTVATSVFTSNPTAVALQFTASLTDYVGGADSTIYTSVQSVALVVNGSTNLVSTVSLDSATVACDAYGNVISGSLTGVKGVFRVYYGSTEVTNVAAAGLAPSLYTNATGGWALTSSTDVDGVGLDYALTGVGTTNNVQFVLSASYTPSGGTPITIYKSVFINKTLAGPQGDTGPGAVYQGVYDPSRHYYCSASRVDVVFYKPTGASTGTYYITNNKALNGDVGGGTTNSGGTGGGGAGPSNWGYPTTDNSNTNWKVFGATFDSVATNILLTQQAIITNYLNMGGYNAGGAVPTTAIRSYSTDATGAANTIPDYLSSGTLPAASITGITSNKNTGLVVGGNGFYLGYPTYPTGGAIPIFYVGNSSGVGSGGTVSGSYMLWDGSVFNINGNININPQNGSGIYSGKTSSGSSSNGFWLGTDTDNYGKFSIGNSTSYLKWDGSANSGAGQLTITGTEVLGGLAVSSYLGVRYTDDNHFLTITGGSGNGVNHGAQIDLGGTGVTSSYAGLLSLNAGDAAYGYIRFATGNAGISPSSSAYVNYERMRVQADGLVRVMGQTATGYSHDAGVGANAGNMQVDGTLTVGSGGAGGTIVLNGVAITSWPSGGGGGGGVTSITGTSNQVIASASTGNVTLSLPQNIDTGANPTFYGVTANAVTIKGGGLSVENSGGTLKAYIDGATGYGEFHNDVAVTGNVSAGSITLGGVSRTTWPSGGGGGGTVTQVQGTGTVSGLTLTGNVTSSGYLTLGGSLTLTSSQITTALGYTPYSNTNPNGYTSTAPYSLPTASTGTLGGVKVDGSTITINGSGVITAHATGSSGVTSIYAGTGVGVNTNTGSVTVSIGQDVGTSSNVTFNTLTVGDGTGSHTVATFSGLVNLQAGTTGPHVIYTTGVDNYGLGLTSGSYGTGANTWLYGNGKADFGGMVSAPTFNSTSSRKWKTNITPITNALDIVTKLQGVTFDWNNKDLNNDFGLIAEEVNEILPTVVGKDKDGEISGVDYGRLTAILIEAVKELSAKVKQLENR
jgi:Chaperone of endosialidase